MVCHVVALVGFLSGVVVTLIIVMAAGRMADHLGG